MSGHWTIWAGLASGILISMAAAASANGQAASRPAEPPDLQTLVGSASQAAEQRDWQSAARDWRAARGLARTSKDRQQLKPLEGRLKEAALAELEQARQMLRDRAFAEAVERYDWVAQTFAGLTPAAQAQSWLERAAKDPVMRLPYREVQARKLYRQVDDLVRKSQQQAVGGAGSASQPAPMILESFQRAEAIAKLGPADQATAVRLLAQIVREYGQSPTGRLAGADLEALREAGVVHDVQMRQGEAYERVIGGYPSYSWYPGSRPRRADPFSDLPPPPPPYGSTFYVPGHGYREYSGDFYWDLRGLHGKLPPPDQPTSMPAPKPGPSRSSERR